ncbi:MAG: hypothetical protein Q8S02_07970 [Hydrogenophaga sp.]|nr:hypothetical protein [Hydrogenophaga sp.]
MGRVLVCWLLAMWSPTAAQATDFSQAVQQALTQAQLAPHALAQPQADVSRAPELLQRFLIDPPAAWHRIDAMRHWPAARHQPTELYRLLTAESGSDAPATDRPPPQAHAAVPVPGDVPEPLALELRRALHGLALAEAWRARALAALPAGLTPQAVLAHTIPAAAGQADTQAPANWPAIDRHALRTGMRILLATAERLHAFITQTPHLPVVVWRTETPWGTVLVDTTGRDNHHPLARPYLVLDVGGSDRYDFAPPAEGTPPGIRLLLDHGGHDRYRSHAPGSGPSAAVMGYALLWDTDGDDDHQAGWLAQGAAVLGAAVHIDDSGHNRYRATGMAQGFALAGDALLLGSPGDDDHRALTLSQASAGPQGTALLLDPGGHDRYHLGNDVLVWPSSQLPEHNASMGQGAGYGTSAGGGLALLIDAAGDDSYRAQLFAQGAGLRQGLGALLDLGGHNRHQAAWYAMGAAAHQGVGLLWAAGAGDDSYEASHVTAMGAGHDAAVGLLVDGGGHDRFVLGDLGLGAAHDGGHGVLVRTRGSARYRFTGTACRGWGKAYASAEAPASAGVGVFIDATAAHPCPAPATGRKQP